MAPATPLCASASPGSLTSRCLENLSTGGESRPSAGPIAAVAAVVAAPPPCSAAAAAAARAAAAAAAASASVTDSSSITWAEGHNSKPQLDLRGKRVCF
jgi:hypothetical protein